MKINFIFYLRHLLSMDRQFYISFIIISHMKHTYRVKNINLLYVNLITQIIRLHLRDILQRDKIHPTNLFHELSNLGWVNNSIGEPSIWTPNHIYPINSWIKDPNVKVNQYTDHNSEEPILELEPTQDPESLLNPILMQPCQVLPLNQTIKPHLFLTLLHHKPVLCKTTLGTVYPWKISKISG
jgi:hypothetical protein